MMSNGRLSCQSFAIHGDIYLYFNNRDEPIHQYYLDKMEGLDGYRFIGRDMPEIVDTFLENGDESLIEVFFFDKDQ